MKLSPKTAPLHFGPIMLAAAPGVTAGPAKTGKSAGRKVRGLVLIKNAYLCAIMYELLETINSPEDLRKLDRRQLGQLC